MKTKDLLSANNKDYFYIMHLSYNGRDKKRLWNYARKMKLIGLDQPSIVTDDWTKIRESVKEMLPNIWVRQFDTFCYEIGKGDIVLVLDGWDELLGVAEIIKDKHQYCRELNVHKASGEERFFDHIREVEWKKEYEYVNRLLLPQPLKGFNNALSKVTPKSKRWQILTELDPY